MQPQYIPTSPRAKNIAGLRFGRLLVIACTGKNSAGRLLWLCRCDCGQEAVVSGKNLRRGQQSCGCLQKEAARTTRYKHGMSNTRIFRTWQAMINRCTNANGPDFKCYGGRGIAVCQDWLDSFEAFYADMGEPPTLQHTLDRIDNDGDYAPDNCRWATRLEQGRNTRKVAKITIDGITRSTPEWAEIAGISAKAISIRIRKGMLPKYAVFNPARIRKPVMPSPS